MQPRILKPTQKDMEDSKYQKTGTGRACDGTINPGVTRKSDTPLKEIWNIFPKGTWNQWPRSFSVPT